MYLIFAGEDYYPSGGFHDLVGCTNNALEMIDVVRASFVVPGWIDNDWTHVCEIDTHCLDCSTDNIKFLGTIKDVDNMLVADGWLRAYLESITCSDCKDIPGYCVCPVTFDIDQGGFVKVGVECK